MKINTERNVSTTLAKKKERQLRLCINQNAVLIMQFHEIGTVARLAANSHIAAPKRNQAWFFDTPW